jgi:hypothetical protein
VTVPVPSQVPGILDGLRHFKSCDEGVTRQGEFQPCEKTAVAVRLDPEEGSPYPVCAYHARGDMVPLAELLDEDQELSEDDREFVNEAFRQKNRAIAAEARAAQLEQSYLYDMDRSQEKLDAAEAERDRLQDLVAEFRKREESQDRIRALLTEERDRLKRALAGHLFDGESLDTHVPCGSCGMTGGIHLSWCTHRSKTELELVKAELADLHRRIDQLEAALNVALYWYDVRAMNPPALGPIAREAQEIAGCRVVGASGPTTNETGDSLGTSTFAGESQEATDG